jgi:hypothetical protein
MFTPGKRPREYDDFVDPFDMGEIKRPRGKEKEPFIVKEQIEPKLRMICNDTGLGMPQPVIFDMLSSSSQHYLKRIIEKLLSYSHNRRQPESSFLQETSHPDDILKKHEIREREEREERAMQDMKDPRKRRRRAKDDLKNGIEDINQALQATADRRKKKQEVPIEEPEAVIEAANYITLRDVLYLCEEDKSLLPRSLIAQIYTTSSDGS